jgi:hypothetical protein
MFKENWKHMCENCFKEAKVISFTEKGLIFYHCESCDSCIDPSLKRKLVKDNELIPIS